MIRMNIMDKDLLDIEILNDDCLLHIFQYLPLKDKLKINAVCKRWQRISLSILSEYKILVLDHPFGDLPPGMSQSIEFSTFKYIAKYCARYLTTVDLTRIMPINICNQKLSVEDVCYILEQCPNVKTLYFTNYLDNFEFKGHRIIDYLRPLCSRLTKFGYVYQFQSIPKEDFNEILAQMTSLKHLYIDSALDETFLQYIPIENFEEIILENCARISLETICEVFKTATKLHTICSSAVLTEDIIELPHNSTIRNLSLTMSVRSDAPNWAASISQFVNIEQLNLELNDNVDDTFLNALAENCKKLTFLNISGCNYVTDDGTANFKSLPKLRHLTISGLVNVTGKNLGNLANLEVLDCNNCENITNGALCGIVWNSSELRILILSHCKLITNKLMKIIINSTIRRKNDLTLHVAVAFTKINLKKLKRKSPRMVVHELITYLVESASNYNAYFPTIHDFYTGAKCIYFPKNRSCRYTRIIMKK